MNQPEPSAGRRILTPRFVLALVIIVVLLWFGLANSQRVRVDYLIADRRSRLIYVILGSALLGALAGRLLQWRRGHERSRRD